MQVASSVRKRSRGRGLAAGQRRGQLSLAQVPEVTRTRESSGLRGRGLKVERENAFITLLVPLSCRILSKLSQEINKNEERRSIFTRK